MSANVLGTRRVTPILLAERPCRIVRQPAAMARLAAKWDRPVVLVPTMGALHAGHVALIQRARRVAGSGGAVVVSIFVNPTQFGPKEDLSKYPRPLARDLELCRRHGADVVFLPPAVAMYAADASLLVDETLLSRGLCGASRAGHFHGVCTVVAKLFNLVQPTAAVFGRKDYQQLAIIKRLVRDLNFPVRIIALDTVRENDGLALSSRNVFLTPEQRMQAPVLRRALRQAAAEAARGGWQASQLRKMITQNLRKDAPLARIDYIEVVDAETLQSLPEETDQRALLAAAVFFGQTRLIDNLEIPVPVVAR